MSKAKASDEEKMNQMSRCVVRPSGGTSPPLPTVGGRDRICFFVALAFVVWLFESFLLDALAKSPADMLPGINSAASIWSVGQKWRRQHYSR